MPMFKRSLLVLLLLVIVGAGGAMYGYSTQDEVIPLDAAEQVSDTVKEQVTVYVTGAVNHPGIVDVDADSRIADAVNACGGALPTADMESVNMAQKLKDGQQVRIPEKHMGAVQLQDGKQASENMKGKGGENLVNINTADEKALDSLPGIGPSMAKRIIEYRNTEGMFQSPEDLKKIRGIGEAKYEKLKDKVTT